MSITRNRDKAGLGDDSLTSGRGNDKLWGGSDAFAGDVFIFGAMPIGKDVIKDFGTRDRIGFGDRIFDSFADVMAATRTVKGNAVISVDANDQVKVEGMTKDKLNPGDFYFIPFF